MTGEVEWGEAGLEKILLLLPASAFPSVAWETKHTTPAAVKLRPYTELAHRGSTGTGYNFSE